MKRFSCFTLIMTIPYALWCLWVILLDPYNYFGLNKNLEIKQKTASKINYALWKLIEFNHNPVPDLLLGDSRMNRIDLKTLDAVTDRKYYSFAFGAGTIPEMCNAFWIAQDKIQLNSVYLGVGFNMYNAYNSADRITRARPVLRNPLLYLINRNVLQSSWYVAKAQYWGKIEEIEKPKTSRSTFWEEQLKSPVKRYYSRYAYPDHYFSELKKITRECEKKSIKMVVLIMPNHVDLQKKVEEFGLSEAYARFLEDMSELSDVYNFDFENEFTLNRDNFSDPFHIKEGNSQQIIEDVWLNTGRISRFIPRRVAFLGQERSAADQR